MLYDFWHRSLYRLVLFSDKCGAAGFHFDDAGVNLKVGWWWLTAFATWTCLSWLIGNQVLINSSWFGRALSQTVVSQYFFMLFSVTSFRAVRLYAMSRCSELCICPESPFDSADFLLFQQFVAFVAPVDTSPFCLLFSVIVPWIFAMNIFRDGLHVFFWFLRSFFLSILFLSMPFLVWRLLFSSYVLVFVFSVVMFGAKEASVASVQSVLAILFVFGVPRVMLETVDYFRDLVGLLYCYAGFGASCFLAFFIYFPE